MNRRQALAHFTAGVVAAALPSALAAAPRPRGRHDVPTGGPPDHPTHAPAVLALARALDALKSLQLSCCGEYPECNVCLTAQGTGYGLASVLAMLECEMLSRPRRLDRMVRSDVAPEQCVPALYDALDALLDMSAFHCTGDAEGCVCEHADAAVYLVRIAIDRIDGFLPSTHAVAVRKHRSLGRCVERARQVEAMGHGWLPQASREHEDLDDELTHSAQMVEALAVMRRRGTRVKVL